MKYPLYILLCVCAVLVPSNLVAADTKRLPFSRNAQPISNGDSGPHTAVSNTLIRKGEALYMRRCGGCHSLDNDRIGPRHRGVYGRKSGSIVGYKYSKALQNLDVIWTEATLAEWLTNPTAFAKGTSMGFRLRKPEERRAIILYLKSLTEPSL